jgi:hypothetical protein
MSMTLNERNPNIVEILIGTQAATISLPGIYFRKHSRIKAVHYIDQAGIAADNTNFLQLSLQDASAVQYATLDTRAAHDGANTALVPQAMDLVGPDLTIDAPATPTAQQEVDVPAGTALRVVVTKNGTGVPTLGRMQIEYYPL